MRKMNVSFFFTVALLAVLLATTGQAINDDLELNTSEEFHFESETNAPDASKIWTTRQTFAETGKIFHLIIPRELFNGEVKNFEVKTSEGKDLPLWLLFDKIGGVLWGVPLYEDLIPSKLLIRAYDSFNTYQEEQILINVHQNDTISICSNNEDTTILTLLFDKGIEVIKPKQRVLAINNIARFMGLPYSAFTLRHQYGKDDLSDSSVVLAGPGDILARSSKLITYLKVPVGCDGRLWAHTVPLIHHLRKQALDGTISEVTGLPLIGWRLKSETKLLLRSKRQVDSDGSGDYYEEEYGDDVDMTYDNSFDSVNPQSSSTTNPVTSIGTRNSTSHPHRHHHGELEFSETEVTPKTTSETVTINSIGTAITKNTTQFSLITTGKSSNTLSSATGYNNVSEDDELDYIYDDEDESQTNIPDFGTTRTPKSTNTVLVEEILPTNSTETEIMPITQKVAPEETTTTFLPTGIPTPSTPSTVIIEDVEITTIMLPPATLSTSTQLDITTLSQIDSQIPLITVASTVNATLSSGVEENTTQLSLKFENVDQDTTVTLGTTIREITTDLNAISTESVEYEQKNFSPFIENRLQHMSVIAGKIFRFVIPPNTFKDFENGYNLTLEFLNARGEILSNESWCHFNPLRREIYGLPLEEDVSKWEYIVKATDSNGASVTDKLTIQVQQHKSLRVVNHEFSLLMRIEKDNGFPHFVDWCLRTLRALGKIYNTNMSEITVRNINYSSNPVFFTWTNDTIPTNYCPYEAIKQLFTVLTANDHGDPSRELNSLLAPELRVKKVLQHRLGVCESAPVIPDTPPTNFPPFLRNPVDHINATIGELLVFRVPDDTFYDPEDTDSRNLNISLLTADRKHLHMHNWLQFDSKNREFYGIPRKVGRSEYQLICLDSAGLPATDSLEIVVYQAPKIAYNVEFSMTIETPYDAFVNSASMQRKFIEKLQEIFGDRNASQIHINPIKQKQESTVVTWFNKTLETLSCPHAEISRLEAIMKNNDRSIATRVHGIMDPDFPVSTIKVLLIGNCRSRHSVIATPPLSPPIFEDHSPTIVDEKTPEANPDNYQYLMTFIIPVVIISIMLFLAALAAIVLYRRRRTGKMNVEENGGASYGNKGIPVIFQEELEEKPEPGTKTPVILKDEKPPLAPPEYSKSGSLKLTDNSEPYQPPPPFTRTQDNVRQARPKPTPTYRKPPPYVPP